MSDEIQLTEAEKEDLRAEVVSARDAVENGYFDLAVLLHKVYDLTLFVEWGYEDWPSYVEGELDLNIRSVQYMIGIADHFGKMDQEIQDWVRSIGWSKAKELTKRVTPENWTEWKKKIAGKSVRQIQDMLKAEKAAEAGEDAKVKEDGEKPVRVAFSLFAEQAAVVQQALDQCKSDADSDKDGNALTLICQDYLAQGGSSLSERLETIEKTFGVKVVAIKTEEDGVAFPYGEDTLNELIASEDDGEE